MTTTTKHRKASTGTHRSLEARILPYTPPWVIGLVVIPATGLAIHNLAGPARLPAIAAGILIATALLATLTWQLGHKRDILIRAHATITTTAAGIHLTTTTLIGLPTPWAWATGITAATLAVSWNLRRTDALRHDTTAQQQQDEWARQLGLTKITPGKPKTIGARVEIPLKHGPGATVTDAQKALPAIEAAAGVPAGRSRVIPNPDDASESTLVLITEDALAKTIPWPGPSHPGTSIATPINLGLYEDHEPATLTIPGGPGRAPAQILYMGMSRSGKTLTALITTAELLTRTDVVLWWGDLTKGEQTAGPIRAGLDWYATTPADARAMFRAAKDIVKARADALGKAGFREWRPECFTHPDLKMPYLVIHLEEASEILEKNTTEFVWLTEKSLSTGVSISVSMQRASHTSMPTDARYNINTALCFGVGDDYSKQFALSDHTIAAGAHPEKWRARKQGYFYLEANGIDDDHFPVPARSFYATDQEIAETVDAYAPIRAKLDRISALAAGPTYTTVTQPQTQPEPIGSDDFDDDLGHEMPNQPEPYLAKLTNHAEPIPPHTGEDLNFGTPPPDAPNTETEMDAFDTLIRQLLAEGATELTVADIATRYPYRHRSTLSRRLTALAEGNLTLPPGIGLDRTNRAGVYTITRTHHPV